MTGDPLPELDLLTLSGEEMLLSKFQGIKTAFLLVSANCEPCKEFLSKIQTNGADPFDPSVKRKVLISISSIDDTLDMLQQIGINHNTFVILVDENKSAAENWGILSTPTTIIADEKLRVVSQIFGN
ncbi:MAG: redoxin domain-containing protein [Anaerolineales bacterium]|nr:redoxin domain-containing protein [Anaerolineales bacterium]